jgi:hypothetical protein
MPFVTTRLRLLPLAMTDGDRLAGLLSEPEVRRYLCDGAILPRETVAALID